MLAYLTHKKIKSFKCFLINKFELVDGKGFATSFILAHHEQS